MATKPSVLHLSEGSWGTATVYKKQADTGISSEDAGGITETTSQEIVTKITPLAQKSLVRSEHGRRGLDEDSLLSGDGSDRMEKALPSLLHSSLFGTILEDTITQLQILVESSNELKIIKTKLDWDFLLRKKYGVKEPDFVDELEAIDPKNLGCNEYKINKLDSDRIYVIDVIKRTYVDLSLNRSFKSLEDSVEVILALDKYRIALAEEEARNRQLRRDLTRQLRQLRNHIKTVLYDSEVKIDSLMAQVEDAVLISECRSRYIDNWQRARTEQHVETIHDSEVAYTDSIEYYKQRTDYEHRVHMEVKMLINIAIDEILQQIEDRMSKYDEDLEAVQLKIQIKKNDYQNMLDKRIDLEKTIAEHEKLMTDWVFFKDEREKARQYRVKMTNAAIAVQAWWRGLLVRRQLGPYKVAKKKKGKDKKK